MKCAGLPILLLLISAAASHAQPRVCAQLSDLGQLGFADNVVAEGDLIAVGSVDEGVSFVEIEDDFSLTEIAQWTEFVTSARDIILDESIAYVANYSDGLLLLDIDNPAMPEEFGRLDTDGLVWRLAVSDTMVYIVQVGSPDNLMIVDASDPREPELVGSLALGVSVETLVVRGDYVYLACYGETILRIVDVSNPSQPAEVGSYGPQGTPAELVLVDNLLYISDGSSSPGYVGLRVLDISDPTDPVSLADYVDPAIRLFTVSGNRLFAPDSLWLDVFDIEDPASRSFVGRFYYEGIGGLVADDTVVYAATGYDGLAVFGCDDSTVVSLQRVPKPGTFQLHSAAPNPFNPTTTIRYTIGHPQIVRLSVFDVKGRLVEILADGPKSAGDHALEFDGSLLTSGVYVAMLESNEGRQAMKMLLLK